MQIWEEQLNGGNGTDITGECWPRMAARTPFSITVPLVVLWEPGFFYLRNSPGVTVLSQRQGGAKAPGPVSQQPECFFLTRQTPEMAREQARLKRPHPKILAELTEKAVYFWFILNLGRLMIQHISGASGRHFISGKGNMLKNKASAEGSRLKRWRRFLVRLFGTQSQT